MRGVKKKKSRPAGQGQHAGHGSEQAAAAPPVASTEQVDRVGPGRPPKQYQWKPGQSGNPSGSKREHKLADDVKALFKRALSQKVNLGRDERAAIMTKLEAGFNTLASQFAEGDHRARRDVFGFAAKLGIDLTAGRASDRDLNGSSQAGVRQALLDRGIPARLLPPIDEAGPEPPPDPPLPADRDETEDEQ
jgi:Family of unknown function (DUF5681)